MTASAPPSRTASSAPLTPAAPRILVVDDDEHIRALIVMVLTDEGYEVEPAGNGAAALDLALARTPDLILLDINMPVIDGHAFAKRYRATRGPHAPIVVFTAGQAAGAIATAIQADDYLDKPFDVSALLALIAARTRGVSGADLRRATPAGAAPAAGFHAHSLRAA